MGVPTIRIRIVWGVYRCPLSMEAAKFVWLIVGAVLVVYRGAWPDFSGFYISLSLGFRGWGQTAQGLLGCGSPASGQEIRVWEWVGASKSQVPFLDAQPRGG